METIATLVKSLFGKESLRDCSFEELQAMARQYSYFTPAQLLLAEKLKSTDENLYQEQLQKLSLHFNNPLWLDYLLNGHTTDIIILPKDENENTNSIEKTVEEKPGYAETESQEIDTTPQHPVPVPDEPGEPADKNINHPEEIIAIEEKQENTEIPNEEIFIKSESEISDSVKAEVDQPADENANTTVEEKQDETEMLNLHLPNLKEESKETKLTFEPYHTVDYFASQGVKFVPEEKPADRFGQQLKSFTEWLKTMKRLPETEMMKMPETPAEEKVQQLADHSISEGEVVTETMAEVWLKQGNKEKAIETYNKLSLLNPAKSHYFAAKIEQLKNS
jgi:hypothetical protein